MNAGVSLPMLSSVNAEQVKALSIPVSGAVVIAPLTQSWRNYGSVGGEFTKLGSASVTAEGLRCEPGSNSGARITTGWSSDFTVSVRAKMIQLAGFTEAGMWSTMQPTSFFAGGWGVAPGANPGYFGMTVPGVGSYSTVVANDLVFHTFTLRRSGTTTELYIDGVLRDSRNTGTSNGTVLVFGGVLINNVFSARTNGVFKNSVQYNSALSPTDLALVEAWTVA